MTSVASQNCQLDDTAHEMATKIRACIANNRDSALRALAVAARDSPTKLAPGDSAVSAALTVFFQCCGDSDPEYMLPRDIIRADEPALQQVRDMMEARILIQKETMLKVSVPQHPRVRDYSKVPSYDQLLAERQKVISNEEFAHRTAECDSYQALHAARCEFGAFFRECTKVLEQRCAYKACRKFGAIKKCHGSCGQFYCCDSCVDSHAVVGQCQSAPS
jgi:hypothetical protein